MAGATNTQHTPLKVAFAGTPEFAAEALRATLAAGFVVPLVLTQPDRPAGRGMKLQASPVKQLALQHGIPVSQPLSLRLDGKFPADAAAARERKEQSVATTAAVADAPVEVPAAPPASLAASASCTALSAGTEISKPSSPV